jgi:hypothetical protein
MYNALGQTVYSGAWENTKTAIQVSNLATGVYVLELTQKTGETYRHRLTKQ